MKPFLTLSEILGPGHVHVPRPHDRFSRWFPTSVLSLDSFSGTSLTFAGSTPVICSAGYTTSAALELFDLARIEIARERIEYRAGEHEEALAAAGPDAKLMFSHAYPPDAPEMAQSWIDPPLLSFLNDKANLAELAGKDVCPRRQVMAWAEFVQNPSPKPVALKVATDQSTGAGMAVVIYRGIEDLPAAQAKFDAVEKVVVEEMLDIAANPCLNFAVDHQGAARFLGAAEQIVGEAGNYLGNWFDLDRPCRDDIVTPAQSVVERAAALGYRGLAGIDMVVTRDGRTFVLDLNFRINSSTPALLLAPELRQRGVRAMRLATVRHLAGAADAARLLAPYVASGHVVPLRLFAPNAAGLAGEAIAHLLVTGGSREEVDFNWAEVGRALALPEA